MIGLKTARGRDLMHRMAAVSDVFLHNYRPGVAERLGLGYESLRAVNLRLVYASGSACGPRGPDASARAYDLLGLARSGIMAESGSPDTGQPGHPKGAIADQIGAIALTYGVLAAIVARERHGMGQEVETSLLGGMLWLQNISIATQPLTHSPVSSGHRSGPANPLWNYYRCADGRWLALAMPQSDRFWSYFVELVGQPELATDERFVDQRQRGANSAACVAILDEIFAAHPRDW